MGAGNSRGLLKKVTYKKCHLRDRNTNDVCKRYS